MRVLTLVLVTFAAGCFLTSPTPPLRVDDHATLGPARADALVIFLPGFGDDGGVFDRYGLIEAVRGHGRYDAVGAHAHFGFYQGFTVIERLEEDLVGPARSMGYRKVWLVGTSMGGFGALSYAAVHREDVAGIVIMAPYLGDPEVLAEIRAVGLDAWEPGDVDALEDGRPKVTRRNWAFVREELRRADGLPIVLGWGEQDPGVPEFELLAASLPEGRVFHRPGGHGWATWTPLFETILAQTPEL
ncbi:MAG: alpha/beta fold hydrolase [Sandaracinus sp.]|nr:alpha/beta fold hydrolase [Sandaracinus sp.]